MKREITTSFQNILIAVIMLSAALHSAYALIGTDTNFWWAFEISISRLVVISLLLIVSSLVCSKLVSLVVNLAVGYYVILLAYELLFIFNQNITVLYYQILVSVYLLISLTLIIYSYVRSTR
jgi:hypothetical protein